MASETETVEGYVIDAACIRKNAREDLAEKARSHASSCALMGHCVESGYGIVTDDDRLTLLDPTATTKVVDAIEDSDEDEGIRLRVHRRETDGTMETVDVETSG